MEEYEPPCDITECLENIITENQLPTLRERVDSGKINLLKKFVLVNKKTFENIFKRLQERQGKTKLKLNVETPQSNNTQDNIDAIKKKLENYVQKYANNNFIDVEYKHSAKFKEEKIGRKYASGAIGVQSMPCPFREFMLLNSNDNDKPLNTDVDIKNAHPCIALDIAKTLKVNTPLLESYVDDRENFMQPYIEQGKTKDVIKTDIIAMLNYQFVSDKRHYDKQMKELDKEFKMLQDTLFVSDDPNFSKYKGKEDNSKGNPKGSFLNIIMTIAENKVITNLYNTLIKNNYEVNALIFDGLLIVGDHYENQELLELCNTAVNILDNVKLQVAFKPLKFELRDLLREMNESPSDENLEPESASSSEDTYNNDMKKSDSDWIKLINQKKVIGDILTNNAKINYKCDEIGGQYMSVQSHTGLVAHVQREIGELFPGRKVFEDYNKRRKVAMAYLTEIGDLGIDTTIFDTAEKIGVPMKNGVFRIETGKVSRATPEEKVHHTTDYNFVEYSYDHPDVQQIEKILLECFRTTEHNYVKHTLGNLLLGCEKKFVVLYGETGNNGKTQVVMVILDKAFGKLSKEMRRGLLTGNNQNTENASPELLSLKYAFINRVNEFNDDTCVNADSIKNLTGDNPISCRDMYESTLHSFSPKGTMVFDTNKMGSFKGFDGPTQKRMIILSFPFEFVDFETYEQAEHRKDEEFKPKQNVKEIFKNIPDFSSKCFSLLFHYLQNYSSDPRCEVIPESLKTIRDQVACSICPISKFVEECCEVGKVGIQKTFRVSLDDILRAFVKFTQNSPNKISNTAFVARMKGLGFTKKRVHMFKMTSYGGVVPAQPWGFDDIKVCKESFCGEVKFHATEDLARYGNYVAEGSETGGDPDDQTLTLSHNDSDEVG